MQNNNLRPEVPLGLGYALALNNKALENFVQMSYEHRKQVIENSRLLTTKQEMQHYVDRIGSKEL